MRADYALDGWRGILAGAARYPGSHPLRGCRLILLSRLSRHADCAFGPSADPALSPCDRRLAGGPWRVTLTACAAALLHVATVDAGWRDARSARVRAGRAA